MKPSEFYRKAREQVLIDKLKSLVLIAEAGFSVSAEAQDIIDRFLKTGRLVFTDRLFYDHKRGIGWKDGTDTLQEG